MALNQIYRRNNDVVSRKILGEMLLVPIRGNLADLQRIFALNPVAEHIWTQLDGKRDLAAIRDSIVAKFTVEPDQAEADLIEFIGQLQAVGLIAEVSGT